MSVYIVTGTNYETGEVFHGEEIDQAGAEHMATTWVQDLPIGSTVDVLAPLPSSTRNHQGHPVFHDQLRIVASFKRVLGGVDDLA